MNETAKKRRAWKSCGGQYKTRLYRCWAHMIERCCNEKCDFYHNYGGRGIKVCDEWRQFLPFKEWADSHGYADDLTIDRIDNDGHYESSNCQWIPLEENCVKHRRRWSVTAFGETKSVDEWVLDPRCTAKCAQTLRGRLRCGWTDEEAISGTRHRERRSVVHVTAFGETKTPSEWLDDSRCVVVNRMTLISRLASGVLPEEAITRPLSKGTPNRRQA